MVIFQALISNPLSGRFWKNFSRSLFYDVSRNGNEYRREKKNISYVTQINNRSVSSMEDIRRILEESDGGIYIEGIYPDGLIAYYAIHL